MKSAILRGLLAMMMPLALVAGATAAEKAARHASPDAGAMCAEMWQSGPEGRSAMREFMQSESAPQAMGTMMEMARRMGHGDVMLGMTRCCSSSG